MRPDSVGPRARLLVLVTVPALLLMLLVAPVAAVERFATVTVDPEAAIDLHTGVITISGTVECTAAGSIELPTLVTQQIGQAQVTGFGFGSAVCAGAGSTRTWQTTVIPDFGKFNPGRIDVFIDGQQCLPDGCAPDPIEIELVAHPLNNVTPPPPPSNDEPAGAIALTLDGGAFVETTAATSGENDPGCPDIQPFSGHTVWFTVTAGTDTGIQLSTAGSDFDTTLVVLDETDTVIACNDDIEPAVIRQSELTFAATAGTTYTIVAGSWETTNGGNLILTATSAAVPPPPPTPPENDQPSGALQLTLGTPLTQDTTAATAGPEDPADGVCDLPLNETTVWYTLDISAADAGWIQVDTLTSNYDTTVYVFDSTGTLLACNDQAAQSNQSLLRFLADAGTYTVLVGSWNLSVGGDLILTATPSVAPLTVELAIDSIGSVDTKTGDATVTGTITCSDEASGIVFVSLFQEGGRFAANSFSELEIASCGPTPTVWSSVLPRESAKFQVGTAFAHGDAFMTSTVAGEAQASADAEVQLGPATSMR